MPAIVYHIGILTKHDEPNYVRYIIKSQMTVLRQFCQAADIYLGLHANKEQIEMILQLAEECELKITDTMSYENDLWEVPTVEWLQNEIALKYDPDDYISYMHTKGMTGHDDKCRDYMMDHQFVQYDKNLEYLKEHPELNAAVCCAHVNHNMKNFAFTYSFWTAKVSHVRNVPAPDRSQDRYASEQFMKLKLGEFLPLDNRITVWRDDLRNEIVLHVPAQYMYGQGWNPSPALKEIIVAIQKECHLTDAQLLKGELKEEEKQNAPKVNQNQSGNKLKLSSATPSQHNIVVYLLLGIPLLIVTALFITFLVLYLRKQ